MGTRTGKPEYAHVAVGAVAAAINGAIVPGLSFVFSKILVVIYYQDTERLKEDAFVYGCVFWAISLVAFTVTFLQNYLFEVVGERLTKRLRSAYFRSLLRQDVVSP